MKKTKLKISGMHCQSCNMLIEDIAEDNGVNSKKFEGDVFVIEFDEKKVKLGKLISEIKLEGYGVREI